MKLLFSVVLGSSLLLCLASCSCSNEPLWEGRPLSMWLNQINDTETPKAKRARIAVEQIGTNAIPFLIKTITSEWHWNPDLMVGNHDSAIAAFNVLGSSASSWIPALDELIQDRARVANVTNIYAIAAAMVAINGNSKEWLADGLDHSVPQLRVACMERLFGLGTNVVDLLPRIAPKLKDNDPEVRVFALMYYFNYATNLLLKVQALQAATNDSNPPVSRYARVKLKGLTP